MPEVVFLPGFMQHADSWSRVAAAVGERYPSRVHEFATWTYAERLAEIRAATGDGDVLVGYSMGGRLALHAALAAATAAAPPRDAHATPEAPRQPRAHPAPGAPAQPPASHPRLSGLVLLGASAGIEDPTARARRASEDTRLADWIESATIEAVVERWERNPVFASQSPELVAAQRAARLRHSPADLAGLLRTAGQGVLEPVWNELGRLAMPVLALAGSNDSAYRAAAQRIASLVPRGEAIAIGGAGHAAHLERPEAVAEAVGGWLERCVGGFWAP